LKRDCAKQGCQNKGRKRDLIIQVRWKSYDIINPNFSGLVGDSCYNGHVYLFGEYDTVDQKKPVKLARDAEGVKLVTHYFLPKKEDDTCGTTANLKPKQFVTPDTGKRSHLFRFCN
jgi:hypothetical protein